NIMSEIESKINEILMEQDDSINYEEEKHLIDDRILDSFAIISLISDLEEEFDVRINAVEMMPENFNSIKAMAAMIRRLQG
ncbi:MAG: acyl carrier protein, partial [Bilifractor sp.]